MGDLLVLLQVQQEETSSHLQSTLQPVGVTVLETDRRSVSNTWNSSLHGDQVLVYIKPVSFAI